MQPKLENQFHQAFYRAHFEDFEFIRYNPGPYFSKSRNVLDFADNSHLIVI